MIMFMINVMNACSESNYIKIRKYYLAKPTCFKMTIETKIFALEYVTGDNSVVFLVYLDYEEAGL